MKFHFDPLFTAFGKLLLRFGVRFPDAADRLKQAMVTAAADRSSKVTDSEVSLATGLQRRDVARLRKAGALKPSQPSPLARIITQWQMADGYFDVEGPKLLHLSGPPPSFESLARSVLKDVHPRTLLDGLVLAGSVQVEGDSVRLMATTFQPAAASEDQIAYLAANVGDHLSAAVENTDEGAWFERAAHFDGLTQDQVDDLHKQYANAQMQVLKDIAATADAMQKTAGPSAEFRFRAGGYFWAEKDKS